MREVSAVVAVMSVQPTSEKRTVRQLAGSAAPAAALAAMPAPAAAKTGSKIHAGNQNHAVSESRARSRSRGGGQSRDGGTILRMMDLSADKRAPPHPVWP